LWIIDFFFFHRNQPASPSPPKSNLSLQQPSLSTFLGDDDEDDDEDHRLNIDDSKEQNTTAFDHDEQSSDDEQVRNVNSKEHSIFVRPKEGARSRLFIAPMDTL
jgi:cytoskeletal protein RodZ